MAIKSSDTPYQEKKIANIPLSNTNSTSTTLRPLTTDQQADLKEKSHSVSPQPNSNAHTQTSETLLSAFNTDPNFGLSEEEVEKRRIEYGENRLKEVKGVSGFKIVLRQVGNAMTLILSKFLSRIQTGVGLTATSVAAMAVSLGTMDWISGGVIAALVILNVVVGTVTEWQAEKVRLQPLASASSPS